MAATKPKKLTCGMMPLAVFCQTLAQIAIGDDRQTTAQTRHIEGLAGRHQGDAALGNLVIQAAMGICLVSPKSRSQWISSLQMARSWRRQNSANLLKFGKRIGPAHRIVWIAEHKQPCIGLHGRFHCIEVQLIVEIAAPKSSWLGSWLAALRVPHALGWLAPKGRADRWAC